MDGIKKYEIEYKIVSAIILLGEHERQKIFSILNESQFQDEIAKRIFQKLRKLFELYPNANGSSYLKGLDDSEKVAVVIATQNSISSELLLNQLDDSIELFKALSSREKFKSELINATLDNDITPSKVREIAERAEQEQEHKKLKNTAEIYLNDYNKPLERIPTGFKNLDFQMNGGFIKGTLATIGARPSTGKTTFAINIASHNPDLNILFFSLEMSGRMIYDRLIADRANIDYKYTGLHQVQFETVKSVLNKYQNLKIVDDVSSVENIVNIIYNCKPDLAIIDFVQIITSNDKFVDNRQRIDYISQVLKQTAKKINCCILTLSQLTRGAAERPTMSALKESGGLEQDCDYVLLLHRQYVNDKSNKDLKPEDTTVILDKNKFGGTKELPYDFNGKYQRFTEVIQKSAGIAHMKSEGGRISADDDLPF